MAMAMYLWRLFVRSVGVASGLAIVIAVLSGSGVAFAVSGMRPLSDDGLTNLGVWGVIGGLAGFALYVVLVGLYLAWTDERGARRKIAGRSN